MNRLYTVVVACCLVFQSQMGFADTSKTIEFENQKEEFFSLENFLKDIKYVEEQVKDTCIKKTPYEENVCNDVTKYKKECKTIPAHEECKKVNNPICHTETKMEEECSRLPSRQQCRQVSEQVCRNETRYENECRTVPGENQCRVVVRYRQECSQTGGGQQCRTIPGEVQCTMVNGENKCVKIPPRQECTNTPAGQQCRQVPYEERECSQGPSRQECHQVPKQERVCENQYRQECKTVPGEYQCQQVARQEQVCRNETQQQCTTVPGEMVCEDVPRNHEVCVDNIKTVCANVPAKEECKDIPYKEQVCKMETKYKEEPYECMKTVKVPKETLIKTHRAEVAVEFTSLSEILGPTFKFALDTKGNMTLKSFGNNEEDDYYTSITTAFVKKEVKAADKGEINDITAKYKILLLNKKEYFKYLETPYLSGVLSKYSFSFYLSGKVDPKRGSLNLKISKKEKIEIDKKISKGNISYKYNKNDNTTTVTVDLKGEGVKIGSIFTGSQAAFYVEAVYSQDYSDAGDMILSIVRDFQWSRASNFSISK